MTVNNTGLAVRDKIHIAVHKINVRVAERVGHPCKHIVIGKKIIAVDNSDYIAGGF